MREIRTYGSEGGGAVSSPYPYRSNSALRGRDAVLCVRFLQYIHTFSYHFRS
jgi:hypothetical protein